MSSVTGVAEVEANLAKFMAEMLIELRAAAAEICAVLKDYATNNHPWKNRTGDTEASIDAQVVEEAADHITLSLFAGMSYDTFLELARGGQWSWLWPALMACQAQIMEILRLHGMAATVGGSMSTTRPDLLTGPMASQMDGNTL